MYCIDTNTLYWLIGIEKLGFQNQSGVDENKLRNFFEHHQIIIPSSVYIESITHFRRQSDKLIILMNYMKLSNARIVNNTGGFFLSEDEYNLALKLGTTTIQLYAEEITKTKIRIETNFIQTIAEIIRLMYLQTVINEKDNISLNEANNILNYLGRQQFYDEEKIIYFKFHNALLNGYSDNKDAEIIKNKINQYLLDQCCFEKAFVDAISAFKNGEDDVVSVLQRSGRKILKKLNKDNGVMQTIRTSLNKKENIAFLNDAKKKIPDMLLKKGYSNNQVGYFRNVMFKEWFDDGEKVRKNDIFDMFCIGALDVKDPSYVPSSVLEDTTTYLITFDKTMRSYIKDVNPYNDKIIEKFCI